MNQFDLRVRGVPGYRVAQPEAEGRQNYPHATPGAYFVRRTSEGHWRAVTSVQFVLTDGGDHVQGTFLSSNWYKGVVELGKRLEVGIIWSCSAQDLRGRIAQLDQLDRH